MAGRKSILNPRAYQALEQLKQEVAGELGIQNYTGYLGDLPARINGAVGGHMVRRMIAAAEQSLINQASAAISAQMNAAIKDHTTGSVSGQQSGYSGQQTGTSFTGQKQF
ncbi:MAG: small, acid-soluble spore protein, alpha/beta type [Limnochordia bacterium]